ncbi:hypothetical protein MBLNU230_g2787t1 [Neophaeotheca triangularis]
MSDGGKTRSLKRTYAQMREASPGTQIDTAAAPTTSTWRPSRTSSPTTPDKSPEVLSGTNASEAVLKRPCPESFHANASILLVGDRRVGKSTLAILAAIAYGRNVVEIDYAFAKATGASTDDFCRQHGPSTYARKRTEIVERTLLSHETNAVIVASLTDLDGASCQKIQLFAEKHPVIHVTTDRTGPRNELGAEEGRERAGSEQARSRMKRVRACSNFSYLNTTKKKPSSSASEQNYDESSPNQRRSVQPFLTLKGVEHDFLKLLRNIFGDHSRGPSHRSAYPLAQIPLEDLSYTHALRVNISELLSGSLDLEDAQVGCDLLEIAIDDSRVSSDVQVSKAFAIVRRMTILPIALTIDSVVSQNDHATALRLVDTSLRLGPEFVTVALDMEAKSLRRLLRCKGGTKIIGAQTWTERPTQGWLSRDCSEAFLHALSLGCDVVRLVLPAHSHDDCFTMHTFRQSIEREHARPTLSLYCSGSYGRSSRCFNKVLQPVRPRSSDQTDGPETALSTAPSLIQARYATFLQEPMQFTVYGARVAYSTSPAMHNAAYQACGMPHAYAAHSSQTLKDLTKIMKAETFGGAAIAQPFKANVIPLIDALSPHARAIGAVNTIIPIRELGKDANGAEAIPSELSIIQQRNRRGPVKALYGDNSDWIGIRACLRKGLSPANSVRPHSTGLVCGAGGMARAAVYSMLSLGVKNVMVWNRIKSNAQALVDHYTKLVATRSTLAGVEPGNAQIRVMDSLTDAWPRALAPPTMIVVGIPAISTDGSEAPNFTLPKHWLHSPTGGVVVELAQKPAVTPVVLQIRPLADEGWVLMDGFDMLPEQAFAQFELFTGCRAPRGVMRRVAERRYAEALLED